MMTNAVFPPRGFHGDPSSIGPPVRPHRHASDVSRFFIRLLQETGRSDTFDSVPFPECHDSITAGAGQGDVIALFIGFIDIVILQVDAIVAEVGLCSEGRGGIISVAVQQLDVIRTGGVLFADVIAMGGSPRGNLTR